MKKSIFEQYRSKYLTQPEIFQYVANLIIRGDSTSWTKELSSAELSSFKRWVKEAITDGRWIVGGIGLLYDVTDLSKLEAWLSNESHDPLPDRHRDLPHSDEVGE